MHTQNIGKQVFDKKMSAKQIFVTRWPLYYLINGFDMFITQADEFHL